MISWLKRHRPAAKQRVCTAVVAAAGSASRMGGINKLLQPLDGVPVLVRTLRALEQAQRVQHIVVAARENELEDIAQLCRDSGISKCRKVVRGGEDRAHSVLLAALEAPSDTELLAVQDGARPLVSPELIDRVIEAASKCGAAAPAIPVKDTVKLVRKDETVKRTLERSALRAVQTPQVFTADLLKAALQSALEHGAAITDDCSAVELLGKPVTLIPGDERNLKITTPIDLVLAEALLQAEKERT